MKEYQTADKTSWGPGPWLSEPDKKEWTDEATGLACLAVRGPGGHWCGYVGVPKSHPWFGKNYADCLEEHEADWHYACTPNGRLSVHGGITFSKACQEPTEESWQEAKNRSLEYAQEAQKYPNGDAAKWLKEWLPYLHSFEAYSAHEAETNICHIGEPVWWFGFDCGHSEDLSPKWRTISSAFDKTYRTLSYVENECKSLAEQLAKVR